MEEHGIIIKKHGQMVVIKTEKSSACEGCSSNGSCSSGATDGKEALVEAENPIDAQVGDKVVFTVSPRAVLKAGMLLYLFPIIAFIAGVVLGQAYGAPLMPQYNADLVAGISGLILLIVAFLAIKAIGASQEPSFKPVVVRVE